MSDLETAINAVWVEHHVERTGFDMTPECRLAASILNLRAKLAVWEAVPERIQALLAKRLECFCGEYPCDTCVEVARISGALSAFFDKLTLDQKLPMPTCDCVEGHRLVHEPGVGLDVREQCRSKPANGIVKCPGCCPHKV